MMDKLLKDILNIQAVSCNQVAMQQYITGNYNNTTTDKKGNIYITKGATDNYPCVVAHLDTVHDIIDENHYHVMQLGRNVFAMNSDIMQLTGIGGDDKCGIYIALYCLEHFDNIKVAFFVDEELGCMGSGAADMEFFDDVGYVIQCDRQGYKDVVTGVSRTELCSDEFQCDIYNLVEEYGKSFCDNGMLTDVCQLKENDLKVSAVNLSCGYYNPHTGHEYINLDDLYNTRDFATAIIDQLKHERYEHEITYRQDYDNGHGFSMHSYYDGIYDVCPECDGLDVIPDAMSGEIYCFDCQDYTNMIPKET